MSTTAQFRFPISAPTPSEAQALSLAAAYLRRAANELETAKLGFARAHSGSSPLDDLPAALSAAGSLCAAVCDASTLTRKEGS